MSACGVFNINSGDATGIQALRDVLSFRALYVLRRPLSSDPSEEGGAGSVPQAEGSIQCCQPRTRWAAQAKRVNYGAAVSRLFCKGLDRKYSGLCRPYGLCHTTQLCCRSTGAAMDNMQANGHVFVPSNNTLLIKTGDTPDLAHAL